MYMRYVVILLLVLVFICITVIWLFKLWKKDKLHIGNKAKNIIILFLSLLLFASCIYNIKLYKVQPRRGFVTEPCVPDPETAIEIATIICRVYTGEELGSDAFICTDKGDEWSLRLKDERDYTNDVIVLDGGVICINKLYGTITTASILKEDVEIYYSVREQYE